MAFQIEGQLFCFAGRLRRRTLKMYTRLVHKNGGRFTSKFNKKVDVLVVGSNPGKVLDKATELGVWVVEEREFEYFIDYGWDIERFDPEPEDETSSNELIGELRSILGESITEKTWDEIVKVLDRASQAASEPLVDYLLDHISRWSVSPTRLLTTPTHWLHEMKSGAQAPKYRLIHTLDLNRELNGTMASKVLECSTLTSVQHVDLYQANGSKRFFTTLRHAPCSDAVCMLTVNEIKAVYARGMEGDHDLSRLRHLRWMVNYNRSSGEDIRRFFNAECFEQINEFSANSLSETVPLFQPVKFPNLQKLYLSGYAYQHRNFEARVLSFLTNHTIRILSLSLPLFDYPRGWKALFDQEMRWPIEVLDLSLVTLENPELAATIWEELANSIFCQGLPAIYLGEHETLANKQAFEAQGIDMLSALPLLDD